MTAFPYTYRAKGRYWYFRRGHLHLALDGEPGSEAFTSSYNLAVKAWEQFQAECAAAERRREEKASIARQSRKPRPKSSDRGTIYFVGSSAGPVKIGFTLDLPRRLHRLQMSSPSRLQVLALRPGSRRDETRLHEKHRKDRLHGEWFRRSNAVLLEVAAALKEAGNES